MSRNAKAKDLAQRGLRGLAGFAKSLKLKFEDIEVGFDFKPEPGLAKNGDLEHDLQALLEATGAAAQQADSAQSQQVELTENALDRMQLKTQEYPYFVAE